jgi:hypothetical protein
VDWAGYGEDLEKNLEVLTRRLHTQHYRTQAVSRQWIPKGNDQQHLITHLVTMIVAGRLENDSTRTAMVLYVSPIILIQAQ